MSKEVGNYGLEVPLGALKRSTCYKKLSDIEKDALHVYNAIQEICENGGHMYLPAKDIFDTPYFQEAENYQLVNSHEEILHFMTDTHKILVKEKVMIRTFFT